MPRRLALALVATLAWILLGGASTAPALAVTIDGDQLDIFVGDTGRLNARFDGATVGVFYPPEADDGNAGATIGFPTTTANPAALDGESVQFGDFTPVSQGPVTGSGTVASPLTQATTLRAGSTSAGVTVVQTVRYVNGQTRFTVVYSVSVNGTAPLNFRLSESADLFIDADDSGVGRLEPGTPRAVLGVNPSSNGGTGGIVEVTPWSHFFEGAFETANGIPTEPDGPGYDDSVDTDEVDNGVGVQFDAFATGAGLAPGNTATFELQWRFTPGDTDGDGSIDGADNCPDVANPGQQDGNGDGIGDACDPDGDAVPSDVDNCPSIANGEQEDTDEDGVGDACEIPDADGDGVADGSDNCGTVANADQRDTDGDRSGDACDPEPRGPDADRDGVLDAADNCPAASNADQRNGDGDGPGDVCDPNTAGPPVLGRAVTAGVTTGTIKVKLPKSGTFQTITGNEAIPTGSVVDATKGAVTIVVAAGAGATQSGTFSAGIFQIKQIQAKRARDQATDLVLGGASFNRQCRRNGKPKPGKKGVVRQLNGSAKGRFRVVARRSAGLLKGTGVWRTQDRCNGTKTTVVRGTIAVRDKGRRKTINVKAGRSYLAKARIFEAKRRRRP